MLNHDFISLELPQEVIEKITSIKGKDVELVVEKQLNQIDIKDGDSLC